MTTLQKKSVLFDVFGQQISIGTLAYFRGRLMNRIHALVLEDFTKLENEKKITKADLARRIGREPAQITRWLGSPGNWTIETWSDLMLGMGHEPSIAVSNLKEVTKQDASPAQEIANAPSAQSVPGVAANDEPKKTEFTPFANTSALGSSAQNPLQAQA